MSESTASGDFSKMTKAQLLERIGELNEKYRLSLEKANPGPQVRLEPVAESDALEECIRALDVLKNSQRSGSNYSSYATIQPFGSNVPTKAPSTPHSRVLTFLAEKYGVELVEVQVRDCGRKHLDQLSPDVLYHALDVAL